MRKEVSFVRKKIDSEQGIEASRSQCSEEGERVQRCLEAFNDKNKEKVQLITKLMEVSFIRPSFSSSNKIASRAVERKPNQTTLIPFRLQPN
ncbi:hypothetical protein LINPERPRIM_LOCUS29829 [Linum perenne]